MPVTHLVTGMLHTGRGRHHEALTEFRAAERSGSQLVSSLALASPWLWPLPLWLWSRPLRLCGAWRFTPGGRGWRGRARRRGLAWRIRVTPRAFLGKETLI